MTDDELCEALEGSLEPLYRTGDPAFGIICELIAEAQERIRTLQSERDEARAEVQRLTDAFLQCTNTKHEAIKHAEALAGALEPFVEALGPVVGPDRERWPDKETIEHSGSAEWITYGHLRQARTAFNQWKEQRANHTPDSPQNATESEQGED